MMTFLYWVFCFSFAFDFRGEKGGSIIQYLFMAAALGSGLLIIATAPRTLRSGPTSTMTLIWGFYLASTAVVAVVGGVVASQYFRCLLPPLLFGIAIGVGQNLIARRYTAEDLLKPLLYAGIASVIFRFIFAVIISKIPIDEVRYEMLSPAIPLLFSAAIASALLAPRMTVLPLVSGLFAIASVLISVTRSYIITLFAAIVSVGLAFLFTMAAKYWSSSDLRKKTMHVLAGTTLVLVAMVLMYLVQPMVFDRWFQRLFNHGGGKTTQDITYLTRAAEAKAIWVLLEADPLCFIYGKGLGANYYWHTSYFPELLQVYPDTQDIDQDWWQPGHSVWTYSLFTGGAYAATSYAFIFMWLVYVGFAGGRRATLYRTDPLDLAYLPFIAGICYFSQTLTSNPFCERFSAQILGLLVAMPQIFYMRSAALKTVDRSTERAPSFLPHSYASSTAHRAG